MERKAYIEMADTEGEHWWFKGRRAIIDRELQSINLPRGSEVAEIGAGTGGNLEMLKRYGRVSAVELDEGARAIAKERTGVDVLPCKLPNYIPLTGRFDLICLFDVLEHVEEDGESLAAIRTLLKPGGRVLLTVPAHQWLWSPHDETLHHKRRYSKSNLISTIEATGYRIDRITFFNSILFPAAVAARMLSKARRTDNTVGGRTPPAAVNSILTNALMVESRLLQIVNLPFGLSLMALLEVNR